MTNATVTIIESRSNREQPAGSVSLDWNPEFSFNPTPGANNTVYALALQPDGKAVVGGDFTAINGIVRNRIARLDTNGFVDAAFYPGTGADGYVSSVALYPAGANAGRILIGGGFTSLNNIQRNSIARLRPNGSLDASFNPGTGADGPVYAVAIQPDGRVVIGGDFTLFNGADRNRVARLNDDGSLDTTFDPGAGADGAIWTLALQNDGHIVLGGDFLAVNGIPLSGTARLTPDGAVDFTFNPGQANGPSMPTLVPFGLPISAAACRRPRQPYERDRHGRQLRNKPSIMISSQHQ